MPTQDGLSPLPSAAEGNLSTAQGPSSATSAVAMHSLGADNDPDANRQESEPLLAQEAQVQPLPPGQALTYALFVLLGATCLLPWNALIVAILFFKLQLQASPFQNSIGSWIPLTYTVSNLLVFAYATWSAPKSRPLSRALLSTFAIMALTLFLCISTQFPDVSVSSFLFFALLETLGLAVATAFLQQATVSLSALFGPSYLQGFLSGQGAIGVFVSVAQVIAAVGSVHSANPRNSSIDSDADEIRSAAFQYFLVYTVFASLAFLAQANFLRIPYCRHVMTQQTEEKKMDQMSHQVLHLQTVERKVRIPGWTIGLVFLTTLAVFPSVTSAVLSVNDVEGGSAIFRPALFVPIGFCVFNVGDYVGRALPSRKPFIFLNVNGLLLGSIARVLFIVCVLAQISLLITWWQPLVLVCNVAGNSTVLFKSDLGACALDQDLKHGLILGAAFMTILFGLAVSNGWVTTLSMMAGVVLPTLEKEEVDTAATCLTFYLTIGLAAGSLWSFFVRAIVCRCNPFLE